MANKFRGRSNDLRALNDIDNASEVTRQYADMKAAEEAQRIIDRYKGLPGFVRLLAHHLNNRTEKIYSKHQRELEASKPENQDRERMRREITAQVHRDLGIGDND